MNHSRQTTILCIAVAVLFVLVLILLSLNFSKISPTTLIPQTGIVPTKNSTPTTVSTSDPTANWKTYKNTKYNYEFKYPSEWEIMGGRLPANNDDYSKGRGIFFTNGNALFGLDINEFDDSGLNRICSTLEDCVNRISLVDSYLKEGTPEKNGKFLNYPAETVTYTRTDTKPDQKNFHLFSIIDENFYHFNFYETTDKFEETKKVFDQILSTFKFTVTPSAKLTPTTAPMADTGPLKTILASINSQLKTSYKEITLDNGKIWSVDLTKSYNKTNVLIMKKAITDFGLIFYPDLGGEAASDWKEVYVKTADTCSLEYSKSVLTLSCYN